MKTSEPMIIFSLVLGLCVGLCMMVGYAIPSDDGLRFLMKLWAGVLTLIWVLIVLLWR